MTLVEFILMSQNAKRNSDSIGRAYRSGMNTTNKITLEVRLGNVVKDG
jgi:hypothetical protein